MKLIIAKPIAKQESTATKIFFYVVAALGAVVSFVLPNRFNGVTAWIVVAGWMYTTFSWKKQALTFIELYRAQCLVTPPKPKPILEESETGDSVIIRRECVSCGERTALYGRFEDGDYVPICSEACSGHHFEKTYSKEKTQ